MHSWMRILASTAAIAFGGVWQAKAAPIFFVDDTPPPSVTNDLAWQASVGSFAEIDFTAFAHGQIVPSFSLGGVTVSVSLPNIGGTPAAIFSGAYHAAGGQYGTVFDNALVTCSQLPCFGDEPAFDIAVTLSFSVPVYGFGAWVFDDGIAMVDSFAMTANGGTSATLDGNPGSGSHFVEGFLGVTDIAGISQVTIFNNNADGHPLELDHIQLSTDPPNEIPVPPVASLTGLGLAGLAFARRRKLRQITRA